MGRSRDSKCPQCAGAASRFAKPRGGSLSMGRVEAGGLPPFFAETRLGSLRRVKFPTGAFANRAATPAPGPGFCLKNKCQKCRWASPNANGNIRNRKEGAPEALTAFPTPLHLDFLDTASPFFIHSA